MNPQSLFRASEVLGMAIEVERQGAAFYEKCAEGTTDTEVRNVFQLLIDQEVEHAQRFSSMKQAMEDYELPESYPGEMRVYLECFVKDRVFSGIEKAIESGREVSHPLAALELALEFEKRSILFYSGIKNVVRLSEHDSIDRVIREEHMHIRRLLELQRSLSESTVDETKPPT